mgnify:CR=1 FL=1
MIDPNSLIGENVCLSGGADGADLQWGMCAGLLGHFVIHWGFDNMKSQAPEIEIARLSRETLSESDIFCLEASKSLGRKFPSTSQYVNDLLRRNYFQVRWAESLYAVGIRRESKIAGGTAWAVEMYKNRFLFPENLYFFDQETNQWLEGVNFKPIDSPPVPRGIWAGIGTRKLNDNGKMAIRKLMSYVKPNA